MAVAGHHSFDSNWMRVQAMYSLTLTYLSKYVHTRGGRNLGSLPTTGEKNSPFFKSTKAQPRPGFPYAHTTISTTRLAADLQQQPFPGTNRKKTSTYQASWISGLMDCFWLQSILTVSPCCKSSQALVLLL